MYLYKTIFNSTHIIPLNRRQWLILYYMNEAETIFTKRKHRKHKLQYVIDNFKKQYPDTNIYILTNYINQLHSKNSYKKFYSFF